MRPLLITTTISLLALSWVYFITIPGIAEKQASNAMQASGIKAQAAEKTSNTIIFKNVELDEDGFTTLENLSLTYSPINFFINKQYETLSLSGLRAIGKVNAQMNVDLPTATALPFKHLNNFEIKDAQFTLKTDTGTATIGIESQGQKKNGAMRLNTQFYLTHESLRLKGNGQGVWNDNGWWQHDFEISEASINTDKLRLKRASGQINLSREPDADINIQGEFRSDGMALANQGWKNASLTIEGPIKSPTMYVSGKASNLEGLELSITFPDLFKNDDYNGNLYAEDPTTIKKLLSSLEGIKNTQALVDRIPLEDPTQVTFRHENNSLKAKIENASQTIDIQNQNESVTALISSPQPFQISANGNLLSIKGDMVLKTDKGGTLFAEVEKATLAFGKLRAEFDKGTIEDKASENWLNCSVRNLTLQHSCAGNFVLKNGKPEFKSIKLRIAEGDVALVTSEENAKIEFTLLNLKALLQHLTLKNWNGQGLISGNANIISSNGETIIQNARFQSHGSGVLKITDDAFLRLLTADEDEQALIHEAMKNLHYDNLKLDVQTIGNKQYRFILSASGKNPNLMNGRKFALSFDFESDISALEGLFFH